MRCPYCDFYSATMRCPHCQSVFDAASAAELAHLSYLRNRLHRWGRHGLLPADSVAWAIAATQPEVSRLQERLGLAPAHPASPPAPAHSVVPPADAGPVASSPLAPPAALELARAPFSWTRVGRYLLSERTLNTLLALGALLILASAFVISTLNPTRLAPAAHFVVMVATTLAFYAAGYGVRRVMALVRTGAALLAIAAALIPLDVWTLGHNRMVRWDAGAVWFVASTLCLPIYLASHAALRDRTFALLSSLAAGSELLAILHLARIPLEWGLCALVALAIGYVLLARRLPRSWSALAWALLWTAQAATPLVLLGLLAARFFPSTWHLVGGTPAPLSEYAVGAAWWLGCAFFALRARLTASLLRGEAGLYHYIAAWTLPVAYLLTLTKAPWSAAWYNLSLALLASAYLAYGYWVEGGAAVRAARLLRRPAYQVAIILSMVAALWPIPVRESQIATLVTLSLAYAAAAVLLRRRLCAYVAIYLLPPAYGLLLSRLGLAVDLQPPVWAGLAALLLATGEGAAWRADEGRRALLETVCGLGAWRSRFASPFFSCGYAVSLVAVGLCLARYALAPLRAGVQTPAPAVIVALLAVVALYVVSAVTRRASVFLYPATWLFVQPGEALLMGIAGRLGHPLTAAAHPWLWAFLGVAYVAAAFGVDRACSHYAKPLYLAGYALAVLPIVLLPLSRLALVQVGLLNLLIYGCSAWLAEHDRQPSLLWLAARLFPRTASAGFRVARTLFAYLLAWAFPLWLLAALSLWRLSAPTMAGDGAVLAALALLYAALGLGARRAGRKRRVGNLSHLPWYLGAYALSALGLLFAAPDPTLRIIALGLAIALYAASALVSRRAGWLYLTAFLLPLLSWSLLEYWGVPPRFYPLGLLPGVAVSLAVAEALRRGLDGGASLSALARRASWSMPFYAAVAAQAILISCGLAALGVATTTSSAGATVALWTALAYAALFLAGALIHRHELTVWGSLAFGAAALEDGLRVLGLSWIDQPPRWAVAAVVAALLGLALRGTRRETLALWARSLCGASIALAGLALLVATVGESVLNNRAALQSLAATTAVMGLLLITYGAQRRERLLGYAGVACLEIGYMLQLALFNVGQPQAFVLPAGLYLLCLAYLERRRGAGMKALLEVAALSLLLGTSLAQAMGLAGDGTGRYAYDVYLMFESVAILGLGALLHWKRSLFAASAAVVADVAILLSDPVRAMNTWYLMAIVGIAMIGAVVVIEQQRRQIPAWIDEWRLRLEAWD